MSAAAAPPAHSVTARQTTMKFERFIPSPSPLEPPLPRRILLLQHRLRPRPEPAVPVAALVPDVREVPLDDAVAIRVNRLVRPDLVEPRPHRRRRRIGDDHLVRPLRGG